jgi:geranylgeranyl pyrophosphate synthase/predicted secreted hydrolase
MAHLSSARRWRVPDAPLEHALDELSDLPNPAREQKVPPRACVHVRVGIRRRSRVRAVCPRFDLDAQKLVSSRTFHFAVLHVARMDALDRGVGVPFEQDTSTDGWPEARPRARAPKPRRPSDWPAAGPIDLAVHDLPHASSTTEWWYLKAHVRTLDGRPLSLFAAFFRVLKGRDEKTGELQWAHSLTWALSDPQRKRYVSESLVDRDAPRLGLEKIDRNEGTRDARIRRAMREVCARGKVPYPDRLFEREPFVANRRLELQYDDARLSKTDDGRYELELRHCREKVACKLVFTPRKPAVRHGDDGVVKGTQGEDMFYYFVPRCDVQGEIDLEGSIIPVGTGDGWFDHEFGRHPEGELSAQKGKRDDIAWNWCGLQLDDGSELSAYRIVDLATQELLGERVLLVDSDGTRHDLKGGTFEPQNMWRSTRSFNEYPTRWMLRVPEAGLALQLDASFADQEFVTVISKPAFWEGRVEAVGTRRGRPVSGVGYVERSGFCSIDDLEGFFSAVGKEVRRSVADLYPHEPTHEQARDLIASKDRDGWMDGVDVDRFARTMIHPVREITDRGGKSWRSYAALACCDIVGGDSRDFVKWLAMPEFMHVGSLIVDDVQDKSDVRRGGPTVHLMYGDAHAINAGTACYFMGQKLLNTEKVSPTDRLRLYDLYFEALRAGHAGQALDLEGFDDVLDEAVERGDGESLEHRILAIHRLKTAAPAAALARMGAVVGGGSQQQIDAVGDFFEGLGLAFQIIDDVLNLRGFGRGLKSTGEDIMHGKVTLPVAKAIARLPLEERRFLWAELHSKPKEPERIAACIDLIERCGALDACVQQANDLVESAWERFDPLVEDSFPKLILRAFGWYVLERHY